MKRARTIFLAAVVGLIVCLGPVSVFNAHAGGWCKGDEEKMKGLIERAGFQWAMIKEELKAGCRHCIVHAKSVVASVALWSLYMNAADSIWIELEKSEPDIKNVLHGDMPDIWKKSSKILSWYNEGKSSSSTDTDVDDLMRVLDYTFLPFAVCKSVRTRDPSYCHVMDKLDSSLTKVCIDFFIDVGVILAGRCEPKSIKAAALLWHVPVQYMKDRCSIFSSSNPTACSGLDFATDIDLASCWAVTSGDARWCDDDDLDKSQRIECQKTFQLAKKVKGINDTLVTSELDNNETIGLQALSAVGMDCSSAAMMSFRKVASRRFHIYFSDSLSTGKDE